MDLKKLLLTALYRTGPLMRLGLKLVELHCLRARIPLVRRIHPWLDPGKNTLSLVPVNVSLGMKSVPLQEEVVSHFIDRAGALVVMDGCGCRVAAGCKNHPHDIGCLFMGETALDFPYTISRRVTREEARSHLAREIREGLVPMIGKTRVDNFVLMTSDRGRLLSVNEACRGCGRHCPAGAVDIRLPDGRFREEAFARISS